MRLLVAGGAGFIGSVLCPMLRERGHDVVVADLLWFGNRLPAEIPVDQRNLFDLTADDLRGYDQVIFLAGLSNDPMAEHSPARNFVENAALPSYLAFAARRAGAKRFVYASSCSVYGYTVNELYDEDAPVVCDYPYGISKLQGERGVMQMEAPGFSTIALRQGTVCGYSPRMRFDLIVNTMFRSAMVNGEITVNNPAIWRPLVDVRDAAEAFIRAVEAEPSVSGIFNVGAGNFTVGEIAESVRDELAALHGDAVPIRVKHIEDFRNYKVSSARAERVLGWRARYGVADMVRSLYERRAEFGDFSDDVFFNIQTFKKLQAAT